LRDECAPPARTLLEPSKGLNESATKLARDEPDNKLASGQALKTKATKKQRKKTPQSQLMHACDKM
jgi:hypothetical protein